MKLKRKDRWIAAAARSVQYFYPELADTFICPTCLEHIPVSQKNRISEAHILPRAAGGRVTTLLCRRCNNTFGKDQDVWLGEYLRLINGGPLNLNQQTGHFDVAEQRVNGRYEVAADGTINFSVRVDKNAPHVLSAFKAKTAKSLRDEGELSLTVSFPLECNMDQALYGFLTAAYLLWFRALGYSWAFQKHLDTAREQIRNPHQRILRRFSAECDDPPWTAPWIGTAELSGELALVAGLADRLVFFPLADRRTLYDLIPLPFKGRLSNVTVLDFGPPNNFHGPAAVLVGDRMVISPDVILRGTHAPVLYFPTDGMPPSVMYPISDSDIEQEAEGRTVRTIKVTPSVEVPDSETGRSPGRA
jgi:hypothetical protein